MVSRYYGLIIQRSVADAVMALKDEKLMLKKV